MRRRLNLKVAIPLAVLALLGLFAAVGLLTRDSGVTVRPESEHAARSSAAAGKAADLAASDETAGAPQVADAGGGAGQGYAAMAATAPLSAHHLVRSGDLSLLVKRDTLLATVDRLNSLTVAMGGYVLSSTVGGEAAGVPGGLEPQVPDAPLASSTGGQAMDVVAMDPYAAITLRVPERLFDSAMKRFAKLGEVQSTSTASEDVTSQYVDLQARLRHYRAVESRLVRFLAATDNVNQMLAVQDRIDEIQLTIEQLSAQLKSLSETTAYGTLSIYLREQGVPQAGAIDPSDTFTGTFLNSVKLLGHGARVTGLALTALLPFALFFGGLAVLAWYVVRRLRRNRQQAAPPAPTSLPTGSALPS